MPVQQTENSISFHEKLPRRFGLGSMLVAFGGLVMTVISVYGFFYLTEQPRFAFVACGLIGFSLFLSPFLDLFSAKRATTIDFPARRVVMEKRSLLRQSIEAYEFSEISRFNAEEDADIDRPFDRWGLQIELKSGKQIQIPTVG